MPLSRNRRRRSELSQVVQSWEDSAGGVLQLYVLIHANRAVV